MKLMTVLGTRPEIIRLSRIIPLLDRHCRHVLVHTGQNRGAALSDSFFKELGIRQPDINFAVRGQSAATRIAAILVKVERAILSEEPDAMLVLGDTDSGLSAIMAKRMGVRIFHMEAGNRCFDDRVPEEVNRRIIDHSSDVLMPYTFNAKNNLMAEGIPQRRIYVVGNPIFEVLKHYGQRSDVLQRLRLKSGKYILATAHRAENVDGVLRLKTIMGALAHAAKTFGLPVVFSTHPRTKDRLRRNSLRGFCGVRLLEPFGYFDFIELEKSAFCVITDSGTVQEETCIMNIPSVTIRDTTERPETIETGGNVLAGVEKSDVVRAVAMAVELPRASQAPPEYLAPQVSATVVKIVLGQCAR